MKTYFNGSVDNLVNCNLAVLLNVQSRESAVNNLILSDLGSYTIEKLKRTNDLVILSKVNSDDGLLFYDFTSDNALNSALDQDGIYDANLVDQSQYIYRYLVYYDILGNPIGFTDIQYDLNIVKYSIHRIKLILDFVIVEKEVQVVTEFSYDDHLVKTDKHLAHLITLHQRNNAVKKSTLDSIEVSRTRPTIYTKNLIEEHQGRLSKQLKIYRYSNDITMNSDLNNNELTFNNPTKVKVGEINVEDLDKSQILDIFTYKYNRFNTIESYTVLIYYNKDYHSLDYISYEQSTDASYTFPLVARIPFRSEGNIKLSLVKVGFQPMVGINFCALKSIKIYQGYNILDKYYLVDVDKLLKKSLANKLNVELDRSELIELITSPVKYGKYTYKNTFNWSFVKNPFTKEIYTYFTHMNRTWISSGSMKLTNILSRFDIDDNILDNPIILCGEGFVCQYDLATNRYRIYTNKTVNQEGNRNDRSSGFIELGYQDSEGFHPANMVIPISNEAILYRVGDIDMASTWKPQVTYGSSDVNLIFNGVTYKGTYLKGDKSDNIIFKISDSDDLVSLSIHWNDDTKDLRLIELLDDNNSEITLFGKKGNHRKLYKLAKVREYDQYDILLTNLVLNGNLYAISNNKLRIL